MMKLSDGHLQDLTSFYWIRIEIESQYGSKSVNKKVREDTLHGLV